MDVGGGFVVPLLSSRKRVAEANYDNIRNVIPKIMPKRGQDSSFRQPPLANYDNIRNVTATDMPIRVQDSLFRQPRRVKSYEQMDDDSRMINQQSESFLPKYKEGWSSSYKTMIRKYLDSSSSSPFTINEAKEKLSAMAELDIEPLQELENSEDVVLSVDHEISLSVGRDPLIETQNQRNVVLEIKAMNDPISSLPQHRSSPTSDMTLNHNRRRWEIRKCVVLGGLNVSITSLVLVTSAARANFSTGDTVALALTNLIAGFFIIRHDISRLQKQSPIRSKVEMGEIMHSLLVYYAVAILSLLFFGSVPPLVYAISYYNLSINNSNLSIILAAAASLSCTAFLATQKAHINDDNNKKPKNWFVYLKTSTTYVFVGVVAFGFSFIVGDMFEEAFVE